MNITRRIEQHPIEIARGTFWRHPHIPEYLFDNPEAFRGWAITQGFVALHSFEHHSDDCRDSRAKGLIPIQVKHSKSGYRHTWVERAEGVV